MTDLNRLITCSFTERELRLILRSAHERGRKLLDTHNAMSQKSYEYFDGSQPTKSEIETVYSDHLEHLSIVEKVRSALSNRSHW